MPYLTYSEYKALSSRELDEETFNKLLPKASAVIDNATNHYYHKVDILTDNTWRVNQFKHALSSQIDYFDVLGATSFEEINNDPQTFSAGRTSVSNASRYKANGQNESKSLLADDVYIYLNGTGLLDAGVRVW